MVANKKINKLTQKLIAVTKFLVIFNLLAIPLYIAIYTDFYFYPLQEFTAKISHAILELFGYNVSLDGNMVIVASKELILRVTVSWDSTGWKSMYALIALVIA